MILKILLSCFNYTGETMGLNRTGLFIWKNIDGEKSLREIGSLLSSEFGIPTESALNDLMSFAKRLYRRFFIVKESEEQIKIE